MIIDRRLNPSGTVNDAYVLGKISFFILIIITCGIKQTVAFLELL